tara:strand:- start:557 stop:769 length:213 start_codon:yes stop_codon:yes gene_type:complete
VKVGDLVNFNDQPGFVFGKDEYGIGLIIEEESVGTINPFKLFTVWWPEYAHGSVEFEHEEIDLLPVPKEE